MVLFLKVISMASRNLLLFCAKKKGKKIKTKLNTYMNVFAEE